MPSKSFEDWWVEKSKYNEIKKSHKMVWDAARAALVAEAENESYVGMPYTEEPKEDYVLMSDLKKLAEGK